MSREPLSSTTSTLRKRVHSAFGTPRGRRRPGRIAVAAVAAVAAMVLASCTTSGEPSSGGEGSGETFTIAIGVDLDTVDPAQQTTTTVQNVIDYALETLTSLDKDGKTQPGLATEWETSESGKEVTLNLR